MSNEKKKMIVIEHDEPEVRFLSCSECGQTVMKCDRCKRAFKPGELACCGILNGRPNYHGHRDAECKTRLA